MILTNENTKQTESEAESESEAQGAVRSSVNQKSESVAESEARRNRSQMDQKSFGIGSGIISQSKNSLQGPFKLRARKKMTALKEKLAEAVRQFPVLYDKSCRDFKDNSKKAGLAWEDVAKQIKLQTGMYCSSEYSFICLMFSLVRTMLLYGCSFLGFFRLTINYCSIVSAWRVPEKQKHRYVWGTAGWELR